MFHGQNVDVSGIVVESVIAEMELLPLIAVTSYAVLRLNGCPTIFKTK